MTNKLKGIGPIQLQNVMENDIKLINKGIISTQNT